MTMTRIRWRNVARLAAGAAVAAVLVAFTGAMVKPKPPQPLPADVGLDGIRGQAVAYASPEHADRRHPRPPADEPPRDRVSPPPKPHHQRRGLTPQQPNDPPAPKPPAPAPPDGMAVSAPAAVPMPAAEPPADEPPSSEPTSPSQSSPENHGPSQFGFEQ